MPNLKDQVHKVFVTSCTEIGNKIEMNIRNSSGFSESIHRILQSPEDADIIIVFLDPLNLENKVDYHKKILKDRIIDEYHEKTFLISTRDSPIVLLRGVYTSAKRSFFNLGRTETGSYTGTSEICDDIITHDFSSNDLDDKSFLMSFMGRVSHPVRKKIFEIDFKREDIFLKDTSDFSVWECRNHYEKLQRQKNFYEVMLKSKFTLCPRGYGSSSIRLFEAMSLGVVPVIISDDWIPTRDIPWEDFCVFIKEREVDRVEDILTEYECKYREMGLLARKTYHKFFSDRNYFDFLIASCLRLQHEQALPESLYWKFGYIILWHAWAERNVRRRLTRTNSLARQFVSKLRGKLSLRTRFKRIITR